MSKKHRISANDKIKYVQDYLEGKYSIRYIASSIGISAESFRQWIRNYTSIGAEVFIMKGNKKYPKELKSYGTGGVAIMTKGKTTTYNERIDIVKNMIKHI